MFGFDEIQAKKQVSPKQSGRPQVLRKQGILIFLVVFIGFSMVFTGFP